MKICARCHKQKPLSEFHKNSRTKDGLHSYCKKCNAFKAKQYQKTEKGKIKLKAYQKKYYQSDKGKASLRKYFQSDKGKVALKRGLNKKIDEGYYRYGKGAISILKQNAKKRGIDFNLTAENLEDWWHSAPDICYYCGLSLVEYIRIRDFIISYRGMNFKITKFKRFYRSPKHQGIRWMTLDRKDNYKGYEISNIVKSCWICNSLKSDFFSVEDMKNITPKIVRNLIKEIEKETV